MRTVDLEEWDPETLVNRVILAIGESEGEPIGLRAAIILKAIEDVTGVPLINDAR